MADLTSKNKISVVKAGSLHARMAEKELLRSVAPVIPAETLDPTKLPNRIAIMIDCSGSMAGEPIKLLEQALQDFIQKSNSSDTSIAIEPFPQKYNASLRIALTNDKMKLWMLCMGISADGGTPMRDAMSYVLHFYGVTRCIIISDGQPNESPAETARAYKSKEIPIDTVHIGSGTSGEDCLREISDITGGLFVKFRDVKSFSTAFSFLLPETRAQAATLFLTAGADEVR